MVHDCRYLRWRSNSTAPVIHTGGPLGVPRPPGDGGPTVQRPCAAGGPVRAGSPPWTESVPAADPNADERCAVERARANGARWTAARAGHLILRAPAAGFILWSG